MNSNKDTNQLVVDNLNYVKSLANKYLGRGVEFEDLVSEGYIAMTQAAMKYDSARGSQFVAYAAPYIRKAMEQMIKQESASYGIQKDTHGSLNHKLTRPMSIDAPLGTNNKYTLLDILVNKDALKLEDNQYFKMIAEDIDATILSLNEREQQVVRKFYGIGCTHLTLAEIAEDMGIKRERARQIRDKAIRKMSQQAKTKVLKNLLKK